VTDLAAYPDARAAVGDLIGEFVQAVYLGSRTLSSIQSGKMPAARITRTGGADDGITDVSDIGLAVFAGDADTAVSVASSCHQRLVSLRLASSDSGTAAGLVDSLEVAQSPELVSAPDVAMTQVVTSAYTVSMRRSAR